MKKRETQMSEKEAVIRPMTEEDVDDVLVVERLSFQTPWSRKAFLSELQNNMVAFYCAVEKDKKVVGYGGVWVILDEAHITNIAVHPDYRGRGYGEKILLFLIEKAASFDCEAITLEVRVSNERAQKLYRKHGFSTKGFRKGYYTDTNEDALVMCRQFSRSEG